MAPIHRRKLEDIIADLGKQVAALQSARAQGPILASYTSATLPAAPPTGLEVYVSDLGLRAWWNGSTWIYPPQQIYKTVLTAPTSLVRLPGGSASIPQVFTNLRLSISAQSDGTTASGYDAAGIQVNGISTASYNWNTWWVTQGGSAVQTTGSTGATNAQCMEVWNAFFGSAGRGIATIDIPNYTDTTSRKTFTSRSAASDGGAAGIQQSYSGTVASIGAITSLTMVMGIGRFTAGSEFSLFGF